MNLLGIILSLFLILCGIAILLVFMYMGMELEIKVSTYLAVICCWTLATIGVAFVIAGIFLMNWMWIFGLIFAILMFGFTYFLPKFKFFYKVGSAYYTISTWLLLFLTSAAFFIGGSIIGNAAIILSALLVGIISYLIFAIMYFG